MMFEAQTEWIAPDNFPDLSGYKLISIDLEKAKHMNDMIIERDYEEKKEKTESWIEGYKKWKANK